MFGIADDILIVGYNAEGKGHNRAVRSVIQTCHKGNLTLNKNKCHFRCSRVPFFGAIIFRCGVQPDPHKLQALEDMPPPL